MLELNKGVDILTDVGGVTTIEEARAGRARGYESVEVATTLDSDLQALAERVSGLTVPVGLEDNQASLQANIDLCSAAADEDPLRCAHNPGFQVEPVGRVPEEHRRLQGARSWPPARLAETG